MGCEPNSLTVSIVQVFHLDSQSGLAGSYGGSGALSAADLALASQMGLTSSGGAAGALSAAAAASRGAFGEGPRIYVGGVPDLVTVAMVRDHFSRWGVVGPLHPVLQTFCLETTDGHMEGWVFGSELVESVESLVNAAYFVRFLRAHVTGQETLGGRFGMCTSPRSAPPGGVATFASSPLSRCR